MFEPVSSVKELTEFTDMRCIVLAHHLGVALEANLLESAIRSNNPGYVLA